MVVSYIRFNDTEIEFIDGDRGANYPKKKDFSSSGYCVFLNTGNVTSDGFNFNKLDFITKEKDQLLRKGKLINRDIVLTTRGTVGNVAYVSENELYKNIRINSGMVIIRSNCSKYDPYFLYSFFRSELFKKQCEYNGSGSAQPQLPISALKNISFPNFDLQTQQKIAQVLSTLDRKIALNQQINAELEKMAKTLYDYWFVQFDFPDENGNPYKSSSGEMVYNPELKREIPKGWEVKKLGEIENNIITGKTPSKANIENFNGIIPFITIGDIRGNTFIVKTDETLTELGASTQKNKFLPEDSICVTCIATVGLVGFTTELSQTNQQINSIICSSPYNKYYLYFSILDFFTVSGAKTGNTFANMNKTDFENIRFIKPNEKVLKDYYDLVNPIFENIKSNAKQTQQLTQLRDFLLPMLMNGQIEVE
ncbi:restriction endonuclease subunit S [Pasteurellaceae bacterium 22721_9_1]